MPTTSAVKLYDPFTGLKLIANRVGGFPKSGVCYRFDAPRPIPPEMIPANSASARANLQAFNSINDYLKSRILVLD